MRKSTIKSLLLGLLMTAGASSAWADGSKRVLNSQDYETATAADWTSPNGTVSFKTGDATYGNYARVDVSGNGNRSCYKYVSYDYEPDGYTSAEMTTKGYVIEFDLRMAGGRQFDRSAAQFIVTTHTTEKGEPNPNLATNGTYSGEDYIFALSQPTNTTGGLETTWYVNDLTNTNNSITLADAWHHFKLTVTETSVDFIITKGTETVKTGSLAVSELPTITGFFGLVGRTYGYLAFDNLDIYDYTASVTVSVPTFTFKKVAGANRVYTIANPNGSGTMYYTTAAADEAPEVGSEAYTSTTETSVDVSFAQSGTYYAYVLHTNGTTTSPVVSQAITAGEVTLATPIFTVTDMVLAEDGFYYPQITFSSDNSKIEGAPVATFDQTSPYTFTGKGSFTVTSSAEGYTSSSATYTVNDSYILKNTIDFGALTADDFDTSVWETATGSPRDRWTNGSAQIPADVTYYKLLDSSADCSAVLDGITITNGAQRQPEVYIGYGLLTPYNQISGNGNNMNFTVNDTQTTDFVVYNGWNNYGSGTFNTVLNGAATFGLYRFDTMLRTIKVYSPEETVTIGSAGYTTYVTKSAVQIPSDIEAFTVDAITSKSVALGVVEKVPAGTPIILKGEGTYTLPFINSADAEDVSSNLLKAGPFAGDGATIYALAKKDVVGFYPVAEGVTVPAGKAYIGVEGEAPVKGYLALGDEADAINNIAVEAANGAIYNIAGQKMESIKNGGLYIVNGKKVVVK
jgi:hypothetical protein